MSHMSLPVHRYPSHVCFCSIEESLLSSFVRLKNHYKDKTGFGNILYSMSLFERNLREKY